jgi:hypothetical protein
MSAVDILSETELEVRDALPDDARHRRALCLACAPRARVL